MADLQLQTVFAQMDVMLSCLCSSERCMMPCPGLDIAYIKARVRQSCKAELQ